MMLLTDVERLGYLSNPLELNQAPYQAGTVRGRHRRPRDRSFTQERNGYGAELVSSQGGPEQLVLNVRICDEGPQAVLNASDAIDLVLALARSWHGIEDVDQPWLNGGAPIVATEMVGYEWQTGDMTQPRRWDILDGDWDIDYEQYGGEPFQVVGVLTLYGNRIAVEEE